MYNEDLCQNACAKNGSLNFVLMIISTLNMHHDTWINFCSKWSELFRARSYKAAKKMAKSSGNNQNNQYSVRQSCCLIKKNLYCLLGKTRTNLLANQYNHDANIRPASVRWTIRRRLSRCLEHGRLNYHCWARRKQRRCTLWLRMKHLRNSRSLETLSYGNMKIRNHDCLNTPSSNVRYFPTECSRIVVYVHGTRSSFFDVASIIALWNELRLRVATKRSENKKKEKTVNCSRRHVVLQTC